jgi:hypothetical protein
MYSVLAPQIIPNAWTCYSAEIVGQYVPTLNFKEFRYGTLYIKILMLSNYGQDNNYTVLVDNLKFELISNN